MRVIHKNSIINFYSSNIVHHIWDGMTESVVIICV